MNDLMKAAMMAKTAAEGDPTLADKIRAKAQAAGDQAKAGVNFAKAKAQAGYGTAAEKAQALKTKATGAYQAMTPAQRKAALIGAGLLTAGAGAAGAYQATKEKKASEMTEEQFLKIASQDTDLDLAGDFELAKQAAEELYQDCLQKMAFAEQLYMEADAADQAEKKAADNGVGEPVSYLDQFKTPAGVTGAAAGISTGAMAGMWAGAKGKLGPLNKVQGGAAGGILGASVVGAVGALNAFQEQKRMARAQELAAQLPG